MIGGLANESGPTASNLDAAAFSDYSQACTLMARADVPGNLDASQQLLEHCIRKEPRFADAHAALGELFLQRYRLSSDTLWTTRAFSSTMEALRLNPDKAAVRISLANIYVATGHTVEAIEELQKAIAADPLRVDAHRNLGEVLGRTGKIEEAIQMFQRAIQLQPADPQTYRMMGQTCQRNSRYQDAVACFLRLTDVQPDNGWAFCQPRKSIATCEIDLLTARSVCRLPDRFANCEIHFPARNRVCWLRNRFADSQKHFRTLKTVS